MTSTSSLGFNAEMANFFRSHSKSVKLSKVEFDKISNLLFSSNTPSKSKLPLFPRATPLTFGSTPIISFEKSSLASSTLKTSKKRLDILFESPKDNLISDKFPMEFDFGTRSVTDEPISSETSNLEVIDNFSENHTKRQIIPKSSIDSSRTMTNAAKELIESMKMNFESPDRSIKQDEKLSDNVPVFEFKIEEKELPKFDFYIPVPEETKTTHEFSFDISIFKEEFVSQTNVPYFDFSIDEI
jgi:hypothetical protein